ncbi:Fpg/Nei family DNA glycosylase, partial [Streptomyces albidoflavus]
LGLFGKVTFGDTVDAPAPPPTDTVRLRIAHQDGYVDLRGPTTCALITDAEKRAIHERLGPDPLRDGDDPARAWARISKSRTTVAALLMDQKVIAGVGNVYRAEVLFRHGIDPYRAGKDLTAGEWDAIWTDLAALMREGVQANRIDTVRPEHTPEAMGRSPRVDDHGGEVYVYRRATMPCHLCGTEIRTAILSSRNLFWCPACQTA